MQLDGIQGQGFHMLKSLPINQVKQDVMSDAASGSLIAPG